MEFPKSLRLGECGVLHSAEGSEDGDISVCFCIGRAPGEISITEESKNPSEFVWCDFIRRWFCGSASFVDVAGCVDLCGVLLRPELLLS